MSQKVVTNIFRYLSRAGAQRLDIFVQPKQINLESRLADDRSWQLALPPSLQDDFLSALRRLSRLAADELVESRTAKIKRGAWQLNFKISVRPFKAGEVISVEFLESPITLWRLNQLGLSAPQLRQVRTFLKRRSGLMVIASEAGGGRSSTLNSLLLEANDPHKNLAWLCSPMEQPVFNIPGVNYLNLGKDSWKRVRQHDFDIIFADDPSSSQEIASALEIAATGRLVIATWEASSLEEARQAVTQAASSDKQRFNALKLVLHQELVAWPRRSPRNPRRRDRLGRFRLFTA